MEDMHIYMHYSLNGKRKVVYRSRVKEEYLPWPENVYILEKVL